MFHPRYQFSSGQSANVATATPTAPGPPFVSGTLKSNPMTPLPSSVSSSQTARTAVFTRPVSGSTSETCLASIVPGSLPITNNPSEPGMSVIRRSSLVSHPLLKSSPRFLTNGPCVDPELSQYHPGSIVDQKSSPGSTACSETIDLDSCIQASSLVQSTPGTMFGSSPGRLGNEAGETSGNGSFTSSQSQRGPSLTAAPASLVPTETSNTLLCRNRYFVIRPAAVRHGPAGLLVRARRADTGSVYNPLDENLSQTQSTCQPPQQQEQRQQPITQAQLPPPAGAS